MSIASCMAPLTAVLSSRVAMERMYARGWLMAFILMRSPSKAPPVFFFDGSTEITAIVLSVNVCRNRRTISSVTEDLPAPPVPVMPRMADLLLVTPAPLNPVNGGTFAASLLPSPLISLDVCSVCWFILVLILILTFSISCNTSSLLNLITSKPKWFNTSVRSESDIIISGSWWYKPSISIINLYSKEMKSAINLSMICCLLNFTPSSCLLLSAFHKTCSASVGVFRCVTANSFNVL